MLARWGAGTAAQRWSRRDDLRRSEAAPGPRGREPATQKVGGRPDPRQQDAQPSPGGKLVSPSRKRAAVVEPQTKFGISERRACEAIGQSREAASVKATPRSDEAPLVKLMLQRACARPRFGYRRIGGLLFLERWRMRLSRVCRLWRREGLKVPQQKGTRRRRGPSASRDSRRERPSRPALLSGRLARVSP